MLSWLIEPGKYQKRQFQGIEYWFSAGTLLVSAKMSYPEFWHLI